MEEIEDFIRQNREKLDVDDPPPRIWEGIKKEIQQGRKRKIIWISAAAMILVVFGSAVFYYFTENYRQGAVASKDSDAMVMKINPVLIETEIYYGNLVNDLYSKAEPLLTGHPDVVRELELDFSHLDSICAAIKKDLRDNIANQEVIEALINNYRIRIRILEEMLEMLNQEEKNTQNDKNHAL